MSQINSYRPNSYQINSYQIKYFQVNLFNGNVIYRPIDKFYMLDDIIRTHSRNYIAQIVFYFDDPDLPFHTLTLRNSLYNNMFVPEFAHFYNQTYDKIEILNSQKLADYKAVINLIENTRNLDIKLKRFIVNPFR